MVREGEAVIIEDLYVKGLARTRLAKSFADAGIGQFRRQLEYKAGACGQNSRTSPSYVATTCALSSIACSSSAYVSIVATPGPSTIWLRIAYASGGWVLGCVAAKSKGRVIPVMSTVALQGAIFRENEPDHL